MSKPNISAVPAAMPVGHRHGLTARTWGRQRHGHTAIAFVRLEPDRINRSPSPLQLSCPGNLLAIPKFLVSNLYHLLTFFTELEICSSILQIISANINRKGHSENI
jgi:hypothetical protein